MMLLAGILHASEWANQRDVLLGNLIEKYSIRKACVKAMMHFYFHLVINIKKKSRAIGISFLKFNHPGRQSHNIPFSIRRA
jgi:hypothetical protein